MQPRDADPGFSTFFTFGFQHDDAIAATTTFKLRTCRRPFRVEQVDYVNPTGYTADATNFYVLSLRKGSTVIAQWSLQTGQQGTLTANTFVQMVLSATDANRVCAAGDEISFVATKAASAANLPLGRICAHCKYV